MSAAPPTKPRPAFWKKLGGAPLWISAGVHGGLLILALIWVFDILPAEPEKTVDFKSRDTGGGGSGSSSKTALQQKRSAAVTRFNTPRVAAVNVSSTFTLPEPTDHSPLTSLSALGASSLSSGLGGSGSGGGKGSGRGIGQGPGNGADPGALHLPSVRFFDQEIKATRIAYVIDFSKSMNGKRQKLMRAELASSVSALTPEQNYQLIFFAGPVWIAGSAVTMADDQKSGVVTSPAGRESRWSAIGAGRWEVAGHAPEALWLNASKSNLDQSVATIHRTQLVNGTYWKPAIDMALELKPAPDIIYFMTDGIVSRNVDEIIDDLSRTARRRKCIINTISMMEPEAADAMRSLAQKSGGTFTMINPDGTTTLARSGN
jgi:hypothetical protein